MEGSRDQKCQNRNLSPHLPDPANPPVLLQRPLRPRNERIKHPCHHPELELLHHTILNTLPLILTLHPNKLVEILVSEARPHLRRLRLELPIAVLQPRHRPLTLPYHLAPRLCPLLQDPVEVRTVSRNLSMVSHRNRTEEELSQTSLVDIERNQWELQHLRAHKSFPVARMRLLLQTIQFSPSKVLSLIDSRLRRNRQELEEEEEGRLNLSLELRITLLLLYRMEWLQLNEDTLPMPRSYSHSSHSSTDTALARPISFSLSLSSLSRNVSLSHSHSLCRSQPLPSLYFIHSSSFAFLRLLLFSQCSQYCSR